GRETANGAAKLCNRVQPCATANQEILAASALSPLDFRVVKASLQRVLRLRDDAGASSRIHHKSQRLALFVCFVCLCSMVSPRCSRSSCRLIGSLVRLLAPPSKCTGSWDRDCWKVSTNGAWCARSSSEAFALSLIGERAQEQVVNCGHGDRFGVPRGRAVADQNGPILAPADRKPMAAAHQFRIQRHHIEERAKP